MENTRICQKLYELFDNFLILCFSFKEVCTDKLRCFTIKLHCWVYSYLWCKTSNDYRYIEKKLAILSHTSLYHLPNMSIEKVDCHRHHYTNMVN